MLRIAICDDEMTARDHLRFQLEKVISEPEEKIVYEFSSGEGAAKWIKKHPGEIDLLLLDVEMKGMDGLKTAAEIRKSDTQILIAFVTGFTDYVFKGYEVNAMDYIVKPASLEQIGRLLTRVRDWLQKKKQDFFTIHNVDGTYRFALSQICYFYSEKRLVYLVTKEAQYSFYEKLNIVEEQLRGKFIRIHQRYLVNPEYVNYIGSESVTVKEVVLPVSRSLKEEATRKLAMYLVGD